MNQFSHSHFFVHVPSQDLDFQRHTLWVFLFFFNDFRWEMIVRFVDIDGNIDITV